MDMQRNTLKKRRLLVLVKGRVTNRRKRSTITLSAWTAAATVCSGKCCYDIQLEKQQNVFYLVPEYVVVDSLLKINSYFCK